LISRGGPCAPSLTEIDSNMVSQTSGCNRVLDKPADLLPRDFAIERLY
jgi:hypothetical protein